MRALPFLLAASLSLAAASASAQDNAAFAQQRYARGTTLYESRDFAHALDEFRASLELYGSPNTRLYVARSLRELGRIDEAMSEYERAMREAADRANSDPRYVATRDAAHAEMVALEPRVGRVIITLDQPPANVVVRVNQREIPAAGLGVPMPVLPGHVEVRVQARGFVDDRRELELGAGQQASVAFPALRRRTTLEGIDETAPGEGAPGTLRPSARGVPRVVPWVVLGVGAAGLVAFGVMGAMASSQFDALESRCGAMRCPESEQAEVDSGRSLQTGANVALGIGITGAVVGGVLMALRRPAERAAAPSSAASPTARLRVAPMGLGLSLGGSF